MDRRVKNLAKKKLLALLDNSTRKTNYNIRIYSYIMKEWGCSKRTLTKLVSMLIKVTHN